MVLIQDEWLLIKVSILEQLATVSLTQSCLIKVQPPVDILIGLPQKHSGECNVYCTFAAIGWQQIVCR